MSTKCEWCGYGYGDIGFFNGSAYVFKCDICKETTAIDYRETLCKPCMVAGHFIEMSRDEDGWYCERCGKYEVTEEN